MVSVLNSGVRCASVMLDGHLVTAVCQPVVLSVITTLVMPRQGSVPAPMGTQVCVIAFFHIWETWWSGPSCLKGGEFYPPDKSLSNSLQGLFY